MRALVTGGSHGLGAALVRRLDADGVEVWIVDRAEPDAKGAGHFLRCDLADRDTLIELTGRLRAAGPFDLVVMSAGINAVGPFESMPLDVVRNLHEVNCVAPILLTRELLAHDLIARGGRLVFVSSLSHFTGYPGASVYAGGKDALVAFARSLRRPLWSRHGIRVQVAAPGPMQTAHAARHAPPGSTGRGRADPDLVARALLRARRRLVIVPGPTAKLSSLVGRLFPDLATRVMRKIIYDRLT
jgi:NAD(P)-dependent dehydrogenase (short-subunit alcohol dehydrogenase family)